MDSWYCGHAQFYSSLSFLSNYHQKLYRCRPFFLSQAMHGAPLYIAETAPSKIRGTLISLKELFIVLGILVSLTFLFKHFELPS